jgi:hypothetical protein
MGIVTAIRAMHNATDKTRLAGVIFIPQPLSRHHGEAIHVPQRVLYGLALSKLQWRVGYPNFGCARALIVPAKEDVYKLYPQWRMSRR